MELFKHFHKPQVEKRMVVILQAKQYDARLDAAPGQSMEFIRQFPAHRLSRRLSMFEEGGGPGSVGAQ
ncbi:hypothetical protein [Hydrogenophaga sp.]|uniref:hypothetical protein n=1 Tax=Hydrogenophaga sp. TaxID=1904254 RepID=UPI003F719809